MVKDKFATWIANQSANYDTLSLTKSARGQALLGVLLFIAFFIAEEFYRGRPIVYFFVESAIFAVFAYLMYKGKRWATVVLMAHLSMQILLMFPIYQAGIWLTMLLSVLYRSLEVENARHKGMGGMVISPID